VLVIYEWDKGGPLSAVRMVEASNIWLKPARSQQHTHPPFKSRHSALVLVPSCPQRICAKFTALALDVYAVIQANIPVPLTSRILAADDTLSAVEVRGALGVLSDARRI